MSKAASRPIVLLSVLGKMTLNANEQVNGLFRAGVSLLPRGSRVPQFVVGSQDHQPKVRALKHRDLLVKFWVAQGWEVRQPWMDKMAKWSDAPARSAPAPENWGPRYVPPGSSENVPQPAAPGDVTAVLNARAIGRAAIPTPARIPIPAAVLPTVPTAPPHRAVPIPAVSPVAPVTPPKPAGDWSAVEGLVRQAVECRECFDRG
ncbi:MAG: hypothetical protein Q7U75_18320, partial [Desulfobacterales bacterium]|nr:hypothetical protein [Desulfobacterales bacterium]